MIPQTQEAAEPSSTPTRSVDLVAPPADGPAGDKCRQLLSRAVAALAGTDGAVFGLGSEPSFEVVSALRDPAAWLAGPLKEAARAAARARQPVLSVVTRGPDQRLSGLAERYLALPLDLDGEMVGALMVTGLPSAQPSADVEIRRLGQLPEMLALALDRMRILAALDKRGHEVRAVRQQLDAFALDFRSTYKAERDRSQQLVDALSALESTYRATVGGLAMAVEAKDECTGGHLFRVSRYGMLVTSIVAPDHADDPQFEYGFLLHDIGKLMVPDMVLNKPGALTDDEWETMRLHPEKGRSILDGIDFLEGARQIVYAHHERWDGKGYPQGLRELEIPLGALIFPLCDAFDAMTSNRPYRTAMPFDVALEQLRSGAGTQFWSEAVDAFLSIPAADIEEIMVQRRCGPS
jgi:HD-GYP domain-containing protein (c-di-GMP phosphodiesterase class II)